MRNSRHSLHALLRQFLLRNVICLVLPVCVLGSLLLSLTLRYGTDIALTTRASEVRAVLMQDLPEAEWDRLFDVNVKGIYHCVNAAMPGFLRTHRGNIVTVSSMWGRVGASCEAAYSATKGAVIALTKALAKELGPSGIRVNCVAPGVILTDMCGSVEPQVLAQMAEETPLGRNGQPEDVARAILLLTESGFVTGTVLNVDGGYAI